MNKILSILFILLAGLLLFQTSKPVSLIKLDNDLDQFETPKQTPYNKLYGNKLPIEKMSCAWDGHNEMYASAPGALRSHGIEDTDSYLDKVTEALRQCKGIENKKEIDKLTKCINVWPDLGFRCYSSAIFILRHTFEEGYQIDGKRRYDIWYYREEDTMG